MSREYVVEVPVESFPEGARPDLAEQFNTPKQQHEAATMGMWIFLATEVLFFGGLFLAYTAYRFAYPEAFGEMSRELNIACGTVNTAILLTSSLTMAMAVQSAQKGDSKRLRRFLALTVLLGSGFMCVKGYEYYDDFSKLLVPGPSFPFHGAHSHQMQLLLYSYYFMTALHATHLSIAIGVMTWMYFRARRGEFSKTYYTPVEVAGLYWHFVDIVWVFLYPMLYLIDRYKT